MKASLLQALEGVTIDANQPANINYVKARCVIEDMAKSRAEKREAKTAVVTLLNGSIIHHQIPPKFKEGQTTLKKEVRFPDGTTARF